MNDIREIKCEACPRVCPEDYQKMVEKYSRACQERDRANEMLQKEQEKHRWIPVTERLPEDSATVLVCHKNGFVKTNAWLGAHWWFKNEINPITHWMPLPQPPEEALKGGNNE